MSQPASRKALYSDLHHIPDNMVGEIIDGEMFATPRPSYRHSHAAFGLSSRLGPPYRFGEGDGPGGWIILYEPEIMLGENLLVPDFAGWKKERFPSVLEENWTTVPPDWVCEILSPSTIRTDRIKKMPIYALHGVDYLWLIDPSSRMLDVFRLDAGHWVLLASFAEDDKVRAEPFAAAEIDLAGLWLV